MADFLTAAWIADINERLARISTHHEELANGDGVVRVVFELIDPPANSARAMTFTLSREGASVAAGDHLGADLVVSLTFADAGQLAAGVLDGGRALREGRLKVRGDVNAIIPFGTWMVAAQSVVID